VKIVLVDDHDILMDGIAALLTDVPHYQVVGKAADIATAMDMIARYQPDVLLTDISIGKESGLFLTGEVTRLHPLINIIVLSMHDELHHIQALTDAGALGYLLKNVKQAELVKAIETVMKGHPYIQHSLAGKLARAKKVEPAAEAHHPLSPREIEIVQYIAKGYTTTAISKALFLSEHTVDTHRKNIGRKTGAKTILSLLQYAREKGIVV